MRRSPEPLLFPKRRRIVKGRDFTLILRRGACVADGTLVLFARRRETSELPSRIGITIGKKTGNAVVRNRWKRWIRESFRTQQLSMPAGYDFVVRPKKDAVGSWLAIQRSIPRLVSRSVKKLHR